MTRTDVGALVVVLLLGLAVRLSVLWLVPRDLAGDSQQYVRMAGNLVSGRGFSHSGAPPYQPDCIRTPGYVVFLAPFVWLRADPTGPVYFVQVLLDLAAVAGLFYLALVTLGGRSRALVASALYAGHPLAAALSGQVLADGLTPLLVVAWLLLLSRDLGSPVRDGLSGAVAGLLALARPALLPLVAGLQVARAWRRRAWLGVAVLSLLLLPWMARNLQVGGIPTPMTLAGSGATLWVGLVHDADPPLVTEGEDDWLWYVQMWTSPEDLTPEETLRVDRQLGDFALQAIALDPAAYGRHVLRQARNLWWTPSGVAQNVSPEVFPRAFVLAYAAIYYQRALVLMALVGLLRNWRRLGGLAPHLAILAYVGLVYPLTHVEGRYLMPALPSLCLLGTLALLPFPRATRSRPGTEGQVSGAAGTLVSP